MLPAPPRAAAQSPETVLLVINGPSAASVQIGEDYARVRAVGADACVVLADLHRRGAGTVDDEEYGLGRLRGRARRGGEHGADQQTMAHGASVMRGAVTRLLAV